MNGARWLKVRSMGVGVKENIGARKFLLRDSFFGKGFQEIFSSKGKTLGGTRNFVVVVSLKVSALRFLFLEKVFRIFSQVSRNFHPV